MRRASLAAVLAAMSAGTVAQTMIRAPGASEVIEIVAHIDILPDHALQAKDAISAYVKAARHEPGALKVDAIQEIRQNHFDVVEMWRDEAAYRAHQSSPATLRFRGVVAPWLGSPLDERLGTQIAR